MQYAILEYRNENYGDSKPSRFELIETEDGRTYKFVENKQQLEAEVLLDTLLEKENNNG